MKEVPQNHLLKSIHAKKPNNILFSTVLIHGSRNMRGIIEYCHLATYDCELLNTERYDLGCYELGRYDLGRYDLGVN